MTARLKRNLTKVKDPGSTLTYSIVMVMAIIAAIPPLSKAAHDPGYLHVSALTVFILNMVGLYVVSTIYHTLNISPKINQMLRRIDYVMVFILIARIHTPVCMTALGDKAGWSLPTPVWGTAAAGILIDALWIACPKWFSSLIYITMGWVCVLTTAKIPSSISKAESMWMLAGGIIYTIGDIIYTLKLPIFNPRYKDFGSREIFHLFVVGGSICHYVMMYRFVAQRHCNAA